MDPEPKRRRRRTETQLARKRQVDRLHQKAKRDQARGQKDQMVSRIEELQEKVDSLSRKLEDAERQLRERANSQHPSVDDGSSVTTAATTDCGNDPAQNCQRELLVDCRCGVVHRSPSDCLEYTTFRILLEAHEALADHDSTSSYSSRLPRTPELTHLFRPPSSEDPVSRVLASFMKQIKGSDTCTVLALYLIIYRFLRVSPIQAQTLKCGEIMLTIKWRLYPHPDTFRDVPSWLVPTKTQESIPHPVSIDFLPWPPLREYLVTHQNQDQRHSVKLYMRAMRFHWPAREDFIAVSSHGQLAPHPDFENEIYRYGNWQLTADWARMFPHLVGLVNVGSDSVCRRNSL